jgi:predicted exporter
MTVAQASGLTGDTRGPVDQRLTAEIEGFRATLGAPIYGEILRRAGHSADARTIPNAERQKQTIEKMQAAARGFERLRQLVEMAGEARFFAAAERFKIASVTELPNLAALKQLIGDLESLASQQVA